MDVDSESGARKEIYSWRVREDVFAGIVDEGMRRDLRDRLIEKPMDSEPPEGRGMDVLEDFVTRADAVIRLGPKDCAPSESQSDEAHDDEEGDPMELNTLLALAMHLKWILACFRGRPGISFSVR